MRIRSTRGPSGIHWPAMFSGADAELLAVLSQLQLSEYWPADRMREAQTLQLEALLRHAERTVPFYARRFQSLGGASALLDVDRWRSLPLLTREQLRAHSFDLRSDNYPLDHGRIGAKHTSGSTGQPVEVLRNEVTQRLWEAILLRDHLWHRRDAGLSVAIIRALMPSAPAPNGRHFDSWGQPYSRFWQTGSMHILDLTTDIAVQAEWLNRIRPAYFQTYSSNCAALLDHFAAIESRPPIVEIVCVGETIPPGLAERSREVLGAKLTANYSSQELGYLALLCPDCHQYHVQSESVLLEVIDEQGLPCAPGTVGRVVVTDLHNFAMPLIRYEHGDYAEVGEPCTAGRTLPTLRKILGRRRNMIVHPDGRRHWPSPGFSKYSTVAPIRQFQFVQHTRDDLEMRLVADTPLTDTQLAALKQIVLEALGMDFTLRFTQHTERLDRGAGGKFEEFVCLTS